MMWNWVRLKSNWRKCNISCPRILETELSMVMAQATSMASWMRHRFALNRGTKPLALKVWKFYKQTRQLVLRTIGSLELLDLLQLVTRKICMLSWLNLSKSINLANKTLFSQCLVFSWVKHLMKMAALHLVDTTCHSMLKLVFQRKMFSGVL